MKIAIGTDHAGVDHKEKLKELAASLGHEVTDMGTYSGESVDYPDFGEKVGLAVCKKEADLGILMCGTGIGISMAANKVRGIRAAVCWSEETARLAREHNNANVLCMGARFISIEDSVRIARVFLETPFSNEERHIKRISKITGIEERSGSCDCG
jgi:ribose 5-phosphate isomerase B